jgi:DNA polymerase
MTPDLDEALSTHWDDFCFIDTETRSPVDVTIHGAYRHTAACSVVIVTYAIGDQPVQEWAVEDFGARLDWDNAPAELRAFHKKAQRGHGWYVAHNAAFDRLAISRGIDNVLITIPMMIDSMAQVVKSHLPADLLGASQWGGVGAEKQKDGKRLIRLFSDASGGATPSSHPEDWQKFLSYARDDVDAMRALFKGTLPLTRRDWGVYWATERINDRGVGVDLGFVAQAAALAELSSSIADTDIRAVTGYGIGQSGMLLAWVREKLRHLPEADAIMLREVVEEQDGAGDVVKLPKHSLDRNRVTELIAMLERLEKDEGLLQEEIDALEALEIKEWGASATPKKFGKMLLQHEDARLKGQFVFNGAPATGRWSSRGIQLQNLGRSTVGKLDDELDAIEIVENDGVGGYDALKKRFGPVGRTLSRLIRPALVPAPGCKLLSSDYSAIEARVLPWLAASEGAEAVLDTFRTNDANPSLPDIYKTTAAKILDKAATDINKEERQVYGKVPCIAEGQLVLTDHGLVPIEKVSLDMMVWDGVSFVSHQGSMYKGDKDVWEYQGLVATADHIVWTEEVGQCEFLDAARRGYRIVQSGTGGYPIRVGDDNFLGKGLHETELAKSLRQHSLQWLRGTKLAKLKQSVARGVERMPSLFSAATDTEMAGSARHRHESPMQKPISSALGFLWWARNRISLLLGSAGWVVGPRELGFAQGYGDRPYRQQRSLRGGELAVGNPAATELEQADKRAGDVGIPTGGLALRGTHRAEQETKGLFATGNIGSCQRSCDQQAEGVATYRGKARVFDIVNAGPRHRFTVSGCLVHNCLALGFGGGNGALFAMAAAYNVSFTNDEATEIVRAWRDTNGWAVRFWDALWNAATDAIASPGEVFSAGRISYVFETDYMYGTLFCLLPNGQTLLYPRIKRTDIEKKDKLTGEVKITRNALTYQRGRGRGVLWGGLLCLGGDTEVATDRGWVKITDVGIGDKLWDGVEYVSHHGLIVQGKKHTILVDGVSMTPDHKVLSKGGWVNGGQSDGLDREEVRMPDGFAESASTYAPDRRKEEGLVAFLVRLRGGRGSIGNRTEKGESQEPYVQAMRETCTKRTVQNSWYGKTPGLCGVQVHDRSLSVAIASGMAQLRRSWDICMRTLGNLRGLLGGYGVNLFTRSYAGSDRQQRRLFPRELQMGGPEDAGYESPKQSSCGHGKGTRADRHFKVDSRLSVEPQTVYDITNAGPRSRFVVRGDGGPFIVHNCENVTQATAGALIREAVVALETQDIVNAVMLIHDEVVAEVSQDRVEEGSRILASGMVDLPAWADGLPVTAVPTPMPYFSKNFD